MIHSKRSHEGYLLIDHSHSPGVDASDLIQAGMDPRRCPDLSGGTKVERATVTCTHCHAIVILNPLRARPRHYCAKCDHYICDRPLCILMASGTLPHRDMDQLFDDLGNAAAKGSLL